MKDAYTVQVSKFTVTQLQRKVEAFEMASAVKYAAIKSTERGVRGF